LPRPRQHISENRRHAQQLNFGTTTCQSQRQGIIDVITDVRVQYDFMSWHEIRMIPPEARTSALRRRTVSSQSREVGHWAKIPVPALDATIDGCIIRGPSEAGTAMIARRIESDVCVIVARGKKV
jgi:hypothetical protein